MSHHFAKRWSINAVSRADRPLSIFRDGLPLPPGAADSADVSPVEHLLMAIAECFALSVGSIVAAHRLPRASFEVIATGEKARDPPSRLGKISLVVLFERAVDESEAAAIVADAERLCTVTNTIMGTVTMSVTSRTGSAASSA